MVAILAIGASRGVGFYASLQLLQAGHTVTMLLRHVDTVTQNPEFVALSEDAKSRATLVYGDAFNTRDVQSAFDKTLDINAVLFSLGGKPSFTLGGIKLDNPDATTRAISVLLPILWARQKQSRSNIRLVIVSTMGLGKEHIHVPLVLKPLYALLRGPHIDKQGLEYLSMQAAGLVWLEPDIPAFVPKYNNAAIGSGWLNELVIVRPALFTDGKETATYRAGDPVKSAYTISRRDVGHFLANRCITSDEFVNKTPAVAY